MVDKGGRMQMALLALLALAIASCVPGCLAFVGSDGKLYYYPDLMAQYNTIGGGGGAAFDTTTCDTSASFEIIKRIKIYSARETINGVFIETTMGRQFTYGSASCDASELIFKHTADDIDTVTSLSLWGNCVGTRLGGIKLTTKSGLTLDVSMKCKGRCTEYNIPIGSGIPCGIFGRAGAEIDAFGMSFLRPVTRRQLRVDSITGQQTSQGVTTLNGGNNGYRTVDNRRGAVAFTTQVSQTTKRTYSEALESTSTFKFSAGVEISYSQKLIVKDISESQFGVKATIGFEVTNSFRTTRTTTDERSFTVTDTYTCPAWNMCDFFDYTIEGALTADYKGSLVYTLDSGFTTAYTDLGRYNLNQGSQRRTTLLTYCCGTTEQCAAQGRTPENPKVACARTATASAQPSSLALPTGADVAPDFTLPANITFVPVEDVVVAPATAGVLATPDAAVTAAATPPQVAQAKECTASPGSCPWVPTSTRYLRVQQGSPGSAADIRVLGEISPTDLSNFANSTLASKSLVSLSLYGCDFGKDCVYEAEVKVLSTLTSLTCQPRSVVMTLVTSAKVGRQLNIPNKARNVGSRLRVVGVNSAGKCVLQLQTVLRKPSKKAASTSPGDTQALSGLEGVACAIGMAKCDQAGIANATACCETLPPIPITPQAACDCPSCFPGDAMVVLEGGVEATMDQLKIGDKVQVLTADGQLRYEPVYLFGHKDSKAISTMIQLAAVSITSREAVQLTLSADHFVPVAAGLKGHIMTRAKDVAVGDRVWAVSGQNSAAELFEVVTVTAKAAQGLFNPFTPAGTIVVNGVVASVHSEWFLDRFMDRLGATHLIPTVYQAILLPLYYAIYCVLGPAWVRFFDDNVDFATVGTINPTVTLISVWSCMSAVAVPMLIVASKVAKAGKNVDV